MARVKRSVHAKKKRRVTLERAKGYYGNKSRSHRAAIGQSLQLGIVELAHASVGGAAVVNDFGFRKQTPRIGRAPHRIGADLETFAARAPEIVERKPGP